MNEEIFSLFPPKRVMEMRRPFEGKSRSEGERLRVISEILREGRRSEVAEIVTRNKNFK